MKTTLRTAVIIGALVASTPALAATNIVVNGSFEGPVIGTSPGYETVPTGGPIVGWDTPIGNVDIVTDNGPYGASSPAGNQFVDLAGTGNGTLTQLLTTVANQVYSFSFIFKNNFYSTGSAAASFRVLDAVSGSRSGFFSGSVASTGATSTSPWQTYNGTFTAQSTSTLLRFDNTVGAAQGGIFLDAVSVSAAPEPASWLMMILGFGLVGGVIRRARTSRELATA